MKRLTLLRSILAVMAVVWAMPQQASEDKWWPSRYGADDRLGAYNLLSPEQVKKAAKLVKTGKTYSLGIVTGPSTPAYPPRTFVLRVTQNDNGTGATFGENEASGNDEWMLTYMGIGSQLDGLGHAGKSHRFYNGVPAEDFVRPTGLIEFGIHQLPPLVSRGVLLDMTHGAPEGRLEGGDVFNRKEIDEAAARQGVQIEEGDVVLFHTGWMAVSHTDPERFLETEPGLGKEGAEYLAGLGVVAVGADTAALEVLPPENPREAVPVHQILLVHHGVYVLENMNTIELARDRAWEFLFVLGQPRFEGAAQAIINPVAIR